MTNRLRTIATTHRCGLANKFVTESNLIEGILRPPSEDELDEFHRFMFLRSVDVEQLQQFVSVYQPGAALREHHGMNVRVGMHVPPVGGMHLRARLEHLLTVTAHEVTSWQLHLLYENLHPFTDGNGRSGRMLWAWQLGWECLELGFLHKFYYQTLANQAHRL